MNGSTKRRKQIMTNNLDISPRTPAKFTIDDIPKSHIVLSKLQAKRSIESRTMFVLGLMCPLCGVRTTIPSNIESIRDTGFCCWCAREGVPYPYSKDD